MVRRVWQDAHDAMLLRLIRQGGVSFSAIASRINDAFGTNYTRNGIAGRTRLLRGGEGRTVRPISRPPYRAPEPSPDAPPTTDRPPTTLIDRGPMQCKWPVNNENPIMFCGEMRAEDDPSYCRRHRWLATRPGGRTR